MNEEMNRSVFASERHRYYFELIIPAIICLLGGYIFWKKVLSPLYFTSIPNSLIIAVLFSSISFVFSFGCGIIEFFMKRIRPQDDTLEIKYVFLFSLVSALVIGVLSGVLEFIYELQPKKSIINPPDEIIYVIDDSGSMYGNDPNDIRLESVVEINDRLKNGTKVGLIRFSDDINTNMAIQVLDENYKNILNANLQKGTDGGTDIGEALQAAIDQYKTCNTESVDKRRSILLITDGESTVPVDEDNIVSQCKKLGVNIDVISLGSRTDLFFLKRITKKTGGHLAKSPSDYYINAAYSIMIGENVKRCLLVPIILIDDYRIILAVLQLSFVFIIGVMIEMVCVFLFRYKPFISRQLKISHRLVFIGSVVLTISDASFTSIFLLMSLILVPLYNARIKKKDIKIPHIHIPLFFRLAKNNQYVDNGIYVSNNYDVNNGNIVDENPYTL